MKAYQTYISDCECESPGVIIEHGKPFCRWCTKPYYPSGMINWLEERFESTEGEDAQSEQDEAIVLLREFYEEIRPHINGHNSSIEKFFNAIELIKTHKP